MILIDTDVLIAHLRGVTAAHAWLRENAERDSLAISALTIVEITSGMRSAERAPVHRLLSAIPAIPVSELISFRAGEWGREYRRSHQGVSSVDLVIAATADTVGAELATLNVKHFPMFPGLAAPFAVS